MNSETKPRLETFEDSPLVLDDEKHMAMALYLIQKAIALREQPDNGWPTIHACLRDAAGHCELARQHWTKESVEEIARVGKELFGEQAEDTHLLHRIVGRHGRPCGCGVEYELDHSEFGLPLGFDLRCRKCGRMWKSRVPV